MCFTFYTPILTFNLFICKTQAYSGKIYPAKSDYELDSKVFSVINMLHDIERKGEKPEEHIFTRSIVRKEKDGGNSKVYSNVLAAAEELALSITSKQQDDKSSPISQEPLDIIAVANNITYYADGLDVYYGYTFKWGDGRGDLIERIYSAAETEDQEGFPVVVEKVEGLAVAVEDQPEPQRKVCSMMCHFVCSYDTSLLILLPLLAYLTGMFWRCI